MLDKPNYVLIKKKQLKKVLSRFHQAKYWYVRFFCKNVYMIINSNISMLSIHQMKYGKKILWTIKIIKACKVFLELNKVILSKECGLYWTMPWLCPSIWLILIILLLKHLLPKINVYKNSLLSMKNAVLFLKVLLKVKKCLNKHRFCLLQLKNLKMEDLRI